MNHTYYTTNNLNNLLNGLFGTNHVLIGTEPSYFRIDLMNFDI
ncbi:hypothetical protein F3D3_0816 [Fusibacter sp. 3D3]|nr:hypothetical protein F3D3_0816 [Fusibacter sp. 3D3]